MAHLIARSARLRGVAVIVAAAALVAASSAIGSVARSSPRLPGVTPERVVTEMIRAIARDPAVSGAVAAHLDLGLPDLPDEGAAAATGPAALLDSLSGDHRLRVWHSRDGSRLSDLVSAGERSIVVSRTQAWLWDSTTMTAVRLGAGAEPGAEAARAAASLIDPVELARRALQALDASTEVSVSGTLSVAGRDAYVLTLRPRTSATLVGRVALFVDAKRWLPLGGAIYTRGATGPAVSVRFTSVSFGDVDPAVYRFQAPPGAKVITPKATPAAGTQGECAPWMDCPVSAASGPLASREQGGNEAAGPSDIRVFGRGWAAILAVRVPSPGALRRATAGSELDPLSFLPFSGTLFSVNLVDRADHGWLTFGAVPKAALERVSAELP
jgi:outer membrane lipoprotein-sorting protein